MNNPKYLLGPMRVPFLILTPACVLLGLATAKWETGTVNILYATLALIGAVSAHISVNAFNEYFDFKSGLDAHTQRTPFSGGSGTLQERPDLARQALHTAIIMFTITGLIGVYFLFVRGFALLPLGLLGLMIILTYTPLLAYNPLSCLIAPGLGFGTLMVLGTHFVLTGHYSWTAFVASCVPFFLVSDLLLLNQFPDVDADRRIGRKHFPILIGRRASSVLYGLFLLFACLTIIFGVAFGLLPNFSLIGLLILAVAVPALLGAYRNANDIANLIPSMGLNVIMNLVTPILVAVGLFIG